MGPARYDDAMSSPRTVIRGTGSYIPPVRVPNDQFLDRDFRTADGAKLTKTNEEIVAQFEAITGIRERRYAPPEVSCTDMAFAAAKDAIDSSGVDPETLDLIIVAHNFGDVRSGREAGGRLFPPPVLGFRLPQIMRCDRLGLFRHRRRLAVTDRSIIVT